MKKNIIIAAVVLFGLIFWVLSGIFVDREDEASDQEAQSVEMLTVRVQELQEQEIAEEITISGKTAPSRMVSVSSELDVRVEEIVAQRGDYVQEGELLVRLDARDLDYKLAEAKSILEQRRLELKSAQELFAKRLSSEAALAQAKGALGRAQALVTLLELDIANTQVKAPFEGLLNQREVEKGDYVKKGDLIAQIVDNDPIIVEADLTEFQVDKVRKGMPARAELSAGGREVDGVIRYVAPKSDDQSRTYRVELEVSNPDLTIPAGQTAKLVIPTETIFAHEVSPSVLTLSDDGQLGVKILKEGNIVDFIPAQLAKSSSESVWLTGLPSTVRLITAGQGFARVGEQVDVAKDTKPVKLGLKGDE